jgi:Tfp pilus assembly protein PilE
MGQQQLLLVILVTIIVGIATVVAINTFGAAADSANLDAVRQDVAQIAAAAQGYYMKPNMLGGGGRSFDDITFTDIAFAASGVSADGLTAENENGRYVLESVTGNAQEFDITAYPSSGDNYTPSTITDGEITTAGTNGDTEGTSTVRANDADPVTFTGGS